MCGVAGAFCQPDGEQIVATMVSRMAHRGPDASGVREAAAGDSRMHLGHRRLSIIDLSAVSDQPFVKDGLALSYNGELYNYRELRTVLEGEGVRFVTSSDTEVVLEAMRRWGADALPRFRGMFAFALFDEHRGRLVLARDPLGIKPLYLMRRGEGVVFASELKALMLDPSVPRDLDRAAIAEYLTFQYIPAPRTPWTGVRKLPPGHYLACDASGPQVRRYWAMPVEPERGRSAEWYRERLRALLAEAVRLRLVADVPLGAFLSGGVDSSVVVALMAEAVNEPIQTFTIGFEGFPGGDEVAHARAVAKHLGTDHHEYTVKPQAIETFTEVQREIERATELPPLPAETRVDVSSNTSVKLGNSRGQKPKSLRSWRGN